MSLLCLLLGHMFEGSIHGPEVSLICRRCGRTWPRIHSVNNQRRRS